MKIWLRWLLSRLILAHLAFFCLFSGLYLLIDLLASFRQVRAQCTFDACIWWFLYRTLRQGQLLGLMSFLSSLVLTNMQMERSLEWLVFASQGFPKRYLCIPHLLVAYFVCGSLFFHQEYLNTSLQAALYELQGESQPPVKLLLRDGTTLIYARNVGRQLLTAYWIKSEHEFWRMNAVELFPGNLGKYIDSFQKQEGGEFAKTESWQEKKVPFAPLISATSSPILSCFAYLKEGIFPGKILLQAALCSLIPPLLPLLAALLLAPILIVPHPKQSSSKEKWGAFLLVGAAYCMQTPLFLGGIFTSFSLTFFLCYAIGALSRYKVS